MDTTPRIRFGGFIVCVYEPNYNVVEVLYQGISRFFAEP